MQTSDNNRMVKANHRKVQASTTLSRKYTKRPARNTDVMVQIKRSPKVSRFGSTEVQTQTTKRNMVEEEMARRGMTEGEMMAKIGMDEEEMMAPTVHPIQSTVNAKMEERARIAQGAQAPRATAKELKDQAIQKALAAANNTNEETTMTSPEKGTKVKTNKVGGKVHFGAGRLLLALSCAAVAVFAIVYFVNLNMPDISLRVAAMQTGMDPTYPNYVPRDYAASGISSEDGKITIEFKNNSTNESFTLTEEKSSWDTNALVSNYVKEEFGEDYTTVREQGLTIYISGSNAAWVNGGIVYKIRSLDTGLTNKQIKSIAVSL